MKKYPLLNFLVGLVLFIPRLIKLFLQIIGDLFLLWFENRFNKKD